MVGNQEEWLILGDFGLWREMLDSCLAVCVLYGHQTLLFTVVQVYFHNPCFALEGSFMAVVSFKKRNLVAYFLSP